MSHRRNAAREVPPLTVSVPRTVRFEEVDALGIAWHGRFASWLEDGREALGDRYGVRYTDFHAQGVSVPLKVFHLDFFHPLRYRQSYVVNASLLWSDAALLDFEYTITDAENVVMASGYTTQLMIGREGRLLLEAPAFYRDFCRRWREGSLS